MTGENKIIGMWRDRDENPDSEQAEATANMASDAHGPEAEQQDSAEEIQQDSESLSDDSWSHYTDEVTTAPARSQYIPVLLLAISALGWTGFFFWANRDIFTAIPSAKAGIDLITQWCLPIATLGVGYLLYMRNSSKEANRFNDVASSLRAESELLEARLKTVNNELSVAREFLSHESRELEFLGDKSSVKLVNAAELMRSSLEDGLGKMVKLDQVGEAAYKNLEQLRDHLPVVINTAKDVTNQIGNAGRTAQTEMAAMVSILRKIGEVGAGAKKSLDELTDKSVLSVESLAAEAERIKASLMKQLDDAGAGSAELANLLEKTTAETIEALRKARSDLASETSESALVMRADLDALEAALASAGKVADGEELRLKALAATLDQTVSEISDNLKKLDNESGDKTANLAFAMAAMEQNSAALQLSLESGHGVADGMIERMERLLVALDSSAREMDETLPYAFERVSEKSKESLALYGQIASEANKAQEDAEKIAERIAQTDLSISQQQEQIQKLREEGDVAGRSIVDQIAAISKSLEEIREQNESLAESAGEKLISALLRVKDTAKQASEHSREVLEKSIAGSTETFERVSEEALNRIIDDKIGSIAPKLEKAVSSAVATTQSTAAHLTDQLAAIEDMTTNLEQRILFAKEKSEQSSDENFTRRVAQLTESLNSISIDVGKILSNDVTDTEWAAYLKGDRGIFTRRAVRLLDNREVREVLAQYSANDEFREHVNRYIHDFEAMLRGVLATRDGSAISVTLLSSDVGKLYVALAQAIERLRS
ncbi:hypothetical protein [uncultured Parasphingorhabdus sp.]|uniref:hypothetical protein n=1 Tax=uncultured Parasphingorhabdus sp. TaxID=2709694 RepID=UPI0030DBBC5C|tara:strand:+ start:13302 stop:15638 length:2337 start_codon:yes stop_codon:yes gene_type:complete